MHNQLTPNSIAFIGLCHEYCSALENARESSRAEFVADITKLLPRLYISASDLNAEADDYNPNIESSLDEDYYDSVRRNVESLMGPSDVYLEVFEDDMKYSDTPIAASISEGLADIFQSLYNFLSMVKNAPEEITIAALSAMKEDFETYWSQILRNVLRAVNHIKYNDTEEYN